MMFLVYDLEDEVVTHRFQDIVDATIVKEALNEIEAVHRRVFPTVLRRIQTFQRHIIVRDSGTNLSDPHNGFHTIPTITLSTLGSAGAGAGAGAGALSSIPVGYANSANAPLPY